MATSLRTFSLLLGLFAGCASALAVPAPTRANTDCIPSPAQAGARPGSFTLDARTRILCESPEAGRTALWLQRRLLELSGHCPIVESAGASVSKSWIRLELSQSGPADTAEGYELEGSAEGLRVQAASVAGLRYGCETLLQLLQARKLRLPDEKLSLESLHLVDSPRYAWRGVMLDESRHFFGKKTVLQLLDVMAELKLNRFHWHLSDEPGWRLEIKKYPKLTSIGATGNWSDAKAAPAFYTQADIREIVAYAAERNIVIIPEIDMPGHATAACRAYPEISGGGEAPWTGFTFNPAREQTYEFLENVLREVADLFPGPYLHLGGDEVHFGNKSWSTAPEILEYTRSLGLKDAVELERHFMRRMARFVRSLDKTVLGWDEIADAGVPASDALVLWWRHDKPQVLDSLLAKHYRVVLSPRIPCYFDFVQHASHTQGRRWEGRFGTLELGHGFPDRFEGRQLPVNDAGIAGLEACIWTERIQNSDRLWFMILPRLASFAEAAWTPASAKSLEDFQRRLPFFLRRCQERGLPFFDPFNPEKTPEPAGPVKKAEGTANG